MPNGPIEPSANSREMAAVLHDTFVGLTQEGFTEVQALAIIGQIIAAHMGGNQ